VGDRRVLTLWALEWAWHPVETTLRYARSSRIYMPSPNLHTFIQTDRQTDTAISTRLVILIKNIYILY